MKFGQLVEYNMKKIFLEKSDTKVMEELVPDLLWKAKIEHISELIVWNQIQFAFIVCQNQGLPKYIETKVLTTCFYLL